MFVVEYKYSKAVGWKQYKQFRVKTSAEKTKEILMARALGRSNTRYRIKECSNG